jgi:hypothetical protein
VEVPSIGLSWPFGCCPQFQNDDFWGVIWVSGKRKGTQTLIRQVWRLQNHWNTLYGQNFIHGDGIVTGSVVMMQHPSVCLPNSSVKMLWMVWWFKFNSLPIIVTDICQSDRMRAFTLVIFSSIIDMQGLLEWGSASMISQPYKMLYAT